ncbi:MAG: hypothetical protein N3B01_11030 [Verrucomicrobiae bacterium]|nr:hypothetical protein [Verrucomicrobiae bacterium]
MAGLRQYWADWLVLVAEPFRHFGSVWLGILPLYVSLLLGELYSRRVSFGHAVGNGFVMLWAGLNWGVRLMGAGLGGYAAPGARRQMVVAWLVTAVTVALGVFTVMLGLRRKDKALCEVLGHTRFSCYFLILLYPMQARLLAWDVSYLLAVLIFAVPFWFVTALVGRAVRGIVR